MNKKQLNNIVILVGLLVFIIYYLNEPFDFNILANSVCGRFIIILLILAATKQNIYLGYLAVVGIIGLLQNLEEENIVTIKKPNFLIAFNYRGIIVFFASNFSNMSSHVPSLVALGG